MQLPLDLLLKRDLLYTKRVNRFMRLFVLLSAAKMQEEKIYDYENKEQRVPYFDR